MDKTQWAIRRLREKYEELGRLPHKVDFDDLSRVKIKAALGPWPRALEKAGLKPVSPRYAKRNGLVQTEDDS